MAMNRRTILGGMTALTGVLALQTESKAKAPFTSNGYGLRVDQFKEIHGEGEPGQSYIQYSMTDGTMFVGQDNTAGVVNFIERYWNPESRGTKEAAMADAQSLLPADAVLNENFAAQFGFIGYSTLIQRYRSGTLKSQYGTAATSTNAIFAVVFEYVPSGTSMEQLVLRYSIVAAEAPTA
jgi:hypothetical protein